MIFKQELAEAILRGEKTATRRRMSDNPRSPWWRQRCSYEVDQVFAVQPGRGQPRVGNARVIDVYPQRLYDMEAPDARAEGFASLEAFIATWKRINGGFFNELVWVIEFELVEAEGQVGG